MNHTGKIGKAGRAALGIAVLLSSGAALADDSLVRFEGGIGVNPVSSATDAGVAARNVVRGVSPGGQPWVISRLRVDVKENGRIRAKGEGLLLGGGNNIGRNGGASVFATLFCGNLPDVEHSSDLAGVPLEPNGDFRIDDVLSPLPPGVCTNAVLLIRTIAPPDRRWFAAGIPKD
jgi:hypothetical protein